jgi:hypothetical protein
MPLQTDKTREKDMSDLIAFKIFGFFISVGPIKSCSRAVGGRSSLGNEYAKDPEVLNY